MGVASINVTAERIESARENSKLAVYKTKYPDQFISFFDAPIKGPDFERLPRADFVGVFHGRKGAEEFKLKARY